MPNLLVRVRNSRIIDNIPRFIDQNIGGIFTGAREMRRK